MPSISDIVAKINKCIGTTETVNSERSTDNSGDSVNARNGIATIEDPPNGGTRAWLIVVSCSAINVLIGALEPTVGLALFGSEEDAGIDEDTLIEIYHIYLSLSSVYAPIASVSMVTVGYELTIHIGSWFLAVSFLLLSFIKNVHGIKFLLYVPAGIGSSLVHMGVLIPVLEYFTTKRMRALMFTRISRYCGQIIPVVIYLTGVAPTWQTVYRICMGLSIPIGLIGLTIPSRKLKRKTRSERKSFIKRTLGLVQLKVLKNAYLWLVCFLFFVYQFGVEPPDAELTETDMSERLDIDASAGKILFNLAPVIGLILGAFLGWLFKFSAERKFYGCMKQTPTAKELFNLILMIMVGIPVLMAVMCFIAPEAANFPYFFIFCMFFFTQLALIEELRDDMLPDVFGRDNVKFVEGLVHMFIGIAGIIATECSADLHWKDSYRMGGGLLFATTVIAVCILIIQSDIAAKIIKINPLTTPDTNEPRSIADSTSALTESEPVYVTRASGPLTEVTRQDEQNILQNNSFRYQFMTSNGPYNIKYVIPRKNRMYGNLENSRSGSDDSIESATPSFPDQNRIPGRTVYTDLHTSRSPDSYGIVQHNGRLPYDLGSAQGGITLQSQYVIYSYNITQQTDGV